jgi:hypothetical protein
MPFQLVICKSECVRALIGISGNCYVRSGSLKFMFHLLSTVETHQVSVKLTTNVFTRVAEG